MAYFLTLSIAKKSKSPVSPVNKVRVAYAFCWNCVKTVVVISQFSLCCFTCAGSYQAYFSDFPTVNNLVSWNGWSSPKKGPKFGLGDTSGHAYVVLLTVECSRSVWCHSAHFLYFRFSDILYLKNGGMALNTYPLCTLSTCTSENQILIRFALKPAVSKIQGCWKSEMHWMTSEWH